MVDRLSCRHPHAGRGADHAVEARHRDHFDDRRDAPAFRANHPAERAAQLRLARGVGDVAHLALEPHDLQRVLGSIGAPARREKAGEAAGRLREHEKRVAHRRRNEELVADELVSAPWPLGADGNRARRVGAHVGPALLLRHRHADRHALLLLGRNVARIVDARLDLRQPLRGEVGLQFDARRRGEGHGDRAAVTGLDLRLHVGARGARHMRALAWVGPGRRMKTFLDRDLHQRVIGRMKAHQIDAPSVAIVGVEFGRVPVRQRPLLQIVGRARARPERFEPARRPRGALAPHRLPQRRIGVEEIIVGEFDRLVEHFMRRGAVGIERAAEIVLSVVQSGHDVQFPSSRRLQRQRA